VKFTFLFIALPLFAFNTLALAQIPNYVPQNGLVGWWPFNGNANDESGNGNHGTVNGATLTTDRFFNSNAAYIFSTITDKISLFSGFTYLTNNRTISFWFNSNPTTREQRVLSYRPSCLGGSENFFEFNLLANANTIQYYHGGGGILTASYNGNSWNNVILTINNSSANLYVNGVLAGNSQSVPAMNQLGIFGLSSVNSCISNFGSNSQFTGIADDIGIWNRALTNCEIQALYQGSTPSAIIAPQSQTNFCQGSSVVLTANQGSSYLWSNGQTTQSITAASSGSYSVQVTNVNGCVANSQPTQVTVNPTPQVSISNNGSTTFCQGDSVVLQASGATNYQWSNNQSGNSISVNQSGSYSTVGTDANGCSDTSNIIQVLVNPLPQVSISNNGSTTFCQGDSVVLQASGATNYQWSTNQSGNAISANQSGNYSTIGTDANGCSDTSNTIQVLVNSLPQVSISNNGSTTFCQGDSVVLQGSGATNYQWSNNQTGNTISAIQSGSYNTIGTDANGCSDTSNTIQVLVNSTPQVSISNNGATTFCQGDSVVLQGSGATNYQWSNNQSGNTISVNQSGSYNTIGTDANGCSDTSNTIQVLVNSLPQVSISNNGATTFCQGDSVVLQGSGATNYQWSNNQSGNAISVNQSGSYNAIGTDANGCSDTSNTIQVLVNPLPQVTISSNGPTEFCQGDSVLLQASGATNYQWNTNQTGSSISVNQSGSFSATGTDANGCMATSNPISVSVVNYPLLVSQPQDLQLQLGSTAVFAVSSQNQTDTYQWESDLGLGFQAINNGGQYNGANTYQLTVSNLIQNNDGQLFRCVVSNGICSIESQTATLTVKPDAGIIGHEAVSFKVLPNPTDGILTISFEKPLMGQYQIKDNLGRVLMSEDIQGGEITLSVEHLPSGVYFVQVGKEQVRFMRN
jgi:hypothetical protein